MHSFRSDSWIKFFELLVKESFNENSHIRLRAISKIQGILCREYDNVKSLLLDTEHPVASRVIKLLHYCFNNEVNSL
jgi:hypothetical protein